jgi:hypothetical protein
MPNVSKKVLSVVASVAVAASGIAALQLTRQRAGAAGPIPSGAASAGLDVTAPQLVPPIEPKATPPAVASPQRRPVVSMASTPLPQEYRILLSRSVFLNQPGQRVGRPTDSGGGAPRSFEASLTFRGVMREGSQSVAFIDDGNSTRRLKVGDKIGRGEIREISLNQLFYQVGDRTIPVDIGMNLTGTGIMTSTTQPSASSGTQTASTSPGSSGGDDVVERMRKRRQQEGGM